MVSARSRPAREVFGGTVMPDWAPVEHDPFAAPQGRPGVGGAQAGASWAPVDHDPFADAAATKEATAPEPEERPGFAQAAATSARTFANDLHRQRAAASQGTTPNLDAHAENLISDDVMEGDDGNLYYKDSEGKLQRTDTNKHVALPGDDGRLRVYARTENTDEGRISSAGRLLMTGMAAGTPRFGVAAPAAGARVLGIGSRTAAPAVHPGWLPASSTNEAIDAAGRLGIDLPRAIASESKNVNLAGQGLMKAPGGAPLYNAIHEGQQGERGLAGALKRAGEATQGVADTSAAGERVTTGIENVFKPESQKLVRQLYDQVDKLVDPTKTAPLTETQNVVADILARRMARGNSDRGAAVDMIAGALARPGGLTYEGLKDLRSAIREIKQKGDTGGLLPPNMSQQELDKLYPALTKDLGNAAEITGGPAARTAWERANTLSRDRKDVLEVLDKVIGPKTRSDEGVMNALHRMAGTGAGADIKTLAETKRALEGIPGIMGGKPQAWQDVSATIISRLGKNSQGEFSPALFIRDFNELSPAAQRMLFTGVGKGNVLDALKDIATVSNKYVQAGKLGNPTGSGTHGAMLTALVTGATRLASGDVMTPIGIAAGVLGANVASRLLGAPATAASVARWSRAIDNLAQAPKLRPLIAYDIASRNLGNTAASAMGDPSLAPDFQKKLQGAVRRTDER
jgi:hypothetical protein